MIKNFCMYILLILAFHCNLEANRELHYRLKYGDRLDISVYGEASTSRVVKVGPDGRINYLFASVPAEGRTIAELRNELTDQLKTYYRYPLLNIVPFEFGWDKYTVIGQVK